MKSKIFISTIFFIFFLQYGFSQETKVSEPKLLVYYFHATSRCPIDLAIEKTTEETLKNNFAEALKNHIIIYQAIDYDDNYNRALVDKYKPFGASLMLIDATNTSKVKDFTDFAYKNVEEHPEKLIELLIKEIKLIVE